MPVAITASRLQATHRDRQMGKIAWFAGAPGTLKSGVCAPPPATGVILISGTSLWVFGAPSRLILNSFFLFLILGEFGRGNPSQQRARFFSTRDSLGKRYTRLWREIISTSNLLLAFTKAARGKRGKSAASSFERNLEENILQLRDELRSGVYRHGRYDSFYIHDPKVRLISAAPFRDRVAHHALCNVIEPLFERQFIYDT